MNILADEEQYLAYEMMLTTLPLNLTNPFDSDHSLNRSKEQFAQKDILQE